MPRLLIALAVLCLFSPSIEAAPILITSGTISGTNHEPVSIEIFGEQFSLKGSGSPSSGSWAVGDCDDQCFPGETYPLDFGWTGNDFGSIGVINGETYPFGCLNDNCGSALIFGQGSFIAPFFTGSESVTIVEPFILFGSLHAPAPTGVPLFESPLEFYGAGTATINFEWRTSARPEGGWLMTSAVYEITPTPVPEPATMALLGIGLAGLSAKRWRQHRKT